MFKMASKISARSVMVGVDDNGVRDINGLVSCIKNPLGPVLVLRKLQLPERNSFPDLFSDTGAGIGKPDERIGIPLIINISNGTINPLLIP